MRKQRYQNVWEAICDAPAEVTTMRLRSELMISLKTHVARRSWNRPAAASHLGATQARVDDLPSGKINLFTLDELVAMAATAGPRIQVHILRGE